MNNFVKLVLIVEQKSKGDKIARGLFNQLLHLELRVYDCIWEYINVNAFCFVILQKFFAPFRFEYNICRCQLTMEL